MTASPSRPPFQERRRRAALLGIGVVLVAVGIGAAAAALWQSDGAGSQQRGPLAARFQRPARISLPPPARATSTRRRRSTHTARPVRILIPVIGVRAEIIRLGLNADHTLQVPTNYAETGWWSGGSRPGDPGPAVVVGHVDSKTGPAVYYRLGELRRGNRITIVRADGTSVRYIVQRLHSYPKAHFPTDQVYGATKQPTLRLITCSGTFDRSSGHYLNNTVVFAKLAPRATTRRTAMRSRRIASPPTTRVTHALPGDAGINDPIALLNHPS